MSALISRNTAAQITAAVLALAVLGYSVLFAWQVHRSVVSPLPPVTTAIRPPVTIAAQGTFPALSDIAQWPVFGRFEAQTVAPAAPPPTPLALRLRGTFTDANPAATFAVIADEGGAAKAYATGATLPGGAQVHAVASDHVVIVRDGQFETLAFHANSDASDSRTSTHRQSTAVTRAVTVKPIAQPAQTTAATASADAIESDAMIRERLEAQMRALREHLKSAG